MTKLAFTLALGELVFLGAVVSGGSAFAKNWNAKSLTEFSEKKLFKTWNKNIQQNELQIGGIKNKRRKLNWGVAGSV